MLSWQAASWIFSPASSPCFLSPSSSAFHSLYHVFSYLPSLLFTDFPPFLLDILFCLPCLPSIQLCCVQVPSLLLPQLRVVVRALLPVAPQMADDLEPFRISNLCICPCLLIDENIMLSSSIMKFCTFRVPHRYVFVLLLLVATLPLIDILGVMVYRVLDEFVCCSLWNNS